MHAMTILKYRKKYVTIVYMKFISVLSIYFYGCIKLISGREGNKKQAKISILKNTLISYIKILRNTLKFIKSL